MAGAAMQAVFGNPLAEPGITGVSAGAAVIAAGLIVTGMVGATSWLLPVGAFVGALGATAIVQGVGHGRASRSTASLLLVGMALNSFLGAITAALIANAPDAENARSAMFWLNGDLTGRTMADVWMVVAPLMIGVSGVLFFARELNMLALGGATAQSAGVNVRLVSNLVLAFAALATASGVAATGIIAFVGLVVPHLVRPGFRRRSHLPAAGIVLGRGHLLDQRGHRRPNDLQPRGASDRNHHLADRCAIPALPGLAQEGSQMSAGLSLTGLTVSYGPRVPS